jgi:hypothetical protein
MASRWATRGTRRPDHEISRDEKRRLAGLRTDLQATALPAPAESGHAGTVTYVNGQTPSRAYWEFADPDQLIGGDAATTDSFFNQAVLTNVWASLGNVYSGASGTDDIKLNDDGNNATGAYVGADGMQLDPSPGPCPRCT